MHPLRLVFALLATSLALAATLGAQSSAPAPAPAPAPAAAPAPTLTRFSLDFPGGTARELADAISKASGKPCNIVASGTAATLRLPPVRVANASLPELLMSLETTTYRLYPNTAGKVQFDDNTIWTLRTNNEGEGRTFCRFYSLAPFIDAGLSADDITTTLTTAWTLLGMEKPKLSFHQETKLLIAVGAHEQLTVIENALAALTPRVAKPDAAPSAPAPAPAKK